MSERFGAVRTWWRPVGVLTGLELRQRVRTTRWQVTLTLLFALVSAVVFGSLYLVVGTLDVSYRNWTVDFYSILLATLMLVGILLAPTLSATAINGDRRDATLAVVQATPITNVQLATGKLLGSWFASLALMAVALPYLVWAVAVAPYGVGYSLLGIAVTALLFLCYSAVGLGVSSLSARPAGSAVLTQAAVFLLVFGLPAVFGLLLPTTARDHSLQRTSYVAAPTPEDEWASTCVTEREDVSFLHSEYVWWLLAPNPVLLVADSFAGHEPRGTHSEFVQAGADPEYGPSFARFVATALSAARSGPYVAHRTCDDNRFVMRYQSDDSPAPEFETYYTRSDRHAERYLGDSWYLGLAANLVIGAAAFAFAARRLRVPAGPLPRGVRIA